MEVTEIKEEDRTVVFAKCPNCKKTYGIIVSASGYEAWKNGMLIQKALPTLDASVREQLITGICDPCWKIMFPIDPDDE